MEELQSCFYGLDDASAMKGRGAAFTPLQGTNQRRFRHFQGCSAMDVEAA
jgi:hypothetical protein